MFACCQLAHYTRERKNITFKKLSSTRGLSKLAENASVSRVRGQNNLWSSVTTFTAKEITSRQKKDSQQKEKPHGKRKNLTARRKDSRPRLFKVFSGERKNITFKKLSSTRGLSKLAENASVSRVRGQNNLWSSVTTFTAKEITSRQKKDSQQKEKPHGKRKNLTAKRLTTAKVEDSYKSVYDFVQLKW